MFPKPHWITNEWMSYHLEIHESAWSNVVVSLHSVVVTSFKIQQVSHKKVLHLHWLRHWGQGLEKGHFNQFDHCFCIFLRENIAPDHDSNHIPNLISCSDGEFPLSGSLLLSWHRVTIWHQNYIVWLYFWLISGSINKSHLKYQKNRLLIEWYHIKCCLLDIREIQ